MTAALLVTLAIVGAFYLGRAMSRESAKVDAAFAISEAWEVADRAMEDLAAETQAHAETKAELADAKQAAADNLTSLRVVLDAHSRDVVLDPLGSDLIPDVPLAVVKGGRR